MSHYSVHHVTLPIYVIVDDNDKEFDLKKELFVESGTKLSGITLAQYTLDRLTNDGTICYWQNPRLKRVS